jgi:hypothetical protein
MLGTARSLKQVDRPIQKLNPCTAVIGRPAGCTWGQSQYLSPYRSTRAFSSEVGTGSREENASRQEAKASVPIQSERKRLWIKAPIWLSASFATTLEMPTRL